MPVDLKATGFVKFCQSDPQNIRRVLMSILSLQDPLKVGVVLSGRQAQGVPFCSHEKATKFDTL